MNQPTSRSSGSTPSTRTSRWSFLHGMRFRLILLVVLAIIPALGLVIYNAIEERRLGLEAARENAFRFAHMASSHQDELLRDTRQMLLTIAQFPAIQEMNPAQAHLILTNILRLNPAYANLALANTSGQVISAAILSTNLVFATDREDLLVALDKRQFHVGPYRVEPEAGKAVLKAAYPLTGANEELLGLVTATLDLDWIYELHREASLPEGSSFTVYDRGRITLARFPNPQGDYVGQRLGSTSSSTNRPSSTSTNSPSATPNSQSITQGLESASTTSTNQAREREPRPIDRSNILTGRDNVRRLYASTRLGIKMGDHAPRVAFGIPVSEAYATSNHLLQRNLFFLAAATLLAFLAAWFGGDAFILRRVRSLLQATRQLRAGDLSARTGTTTSRGELEQLARTFDGMAENLEQQFAERTRAEAALKSLNEELEHRVENRTVQLKRSNENLQQFAYVASHDLQEPLRMVTSYLELLRKRYDDKLDEDGREFIGFAVDGAQRMHRLINDLLAYSRLQTRVDPFQEINLNELLERVRDNLKIALEESQAQLEIGPMPTLQGDPVQLIQLFQNLISNAIKFRGKESPRISVRAEDSEDTWTLSVQDNGIGIAPENFDRVFAVFQRLHTREQYPGTGIGLAVCKKVMERHGGSIRIESAPGKGTTFHLAFPKTPPEPEDPEILSTKPTQQSMPS